MKKIINSGTRICCKGTSVTRVLNILATNNVEITNVSKSDSRTLEFNISDRNLNKLKTLDLRSYTIEVKSIGGKKKLLKNLISHLGLIVGLAISIFAMFFINNRMLNISISGLSKYSESEIVNSINDYGVNYFSKMDFDIEGLESHLTNNFNFSMVSIITKGNTLIINIKEELSDISEKYLPLTAEYNMVIRNINVFAGTTNVKEGDIIYKGDTIVYPYELINGERIDIVPMAEINADLYYSAHYDFKLQEKRIERTGKSKVIDVSYNLGKIKLFHESKDNPYLSFEREEVSQSISNYFLPISMNKVIAYETTEVLVTNNFEEMKNDIIEKLKVELYSQIPDNLEIENEEIKISSTNYGNIVTIYAKSSVYLNYK